MRTYPMMKVTAVGIETAAWWIHILLTAVALAAAAPPMVLPMAISALVTQHFKQQHNPKTDLDNSIAELLRLQVATLEALPQAISTAVAKAVATELATSSLRSLPVPVPGTLGQPTKTILEARSWLDAHPESAEMSVRKIAALSGFSKSTIDRAKKIERTDDK